MLKRIVQAVLALASTLAAALVVGQLSTPLKELSPSRQILFGIIVVAASAALLALLEAKRALPINWWWHRFWYLSDLVDHLHVRLKRELSAGASTGLGEVSAVHVLVDMERRPLVTHVLSLLKKKTTTPRILVLGPPGSGKSVALADLAYEFARHQRRRLGVGAPMPVLVRMGALTQSGLLTYVAHTMKFQTSGRSGEILSNGLEDLARRGRILLLVDAIDETPRGSRASIDRDIQQLGSMAFARLPLVLSGRSREVHPGEFSDLNLTTFEIQDLDDAAVDVFIRAYSNGPPARADGSSEVRARLEAHDLLAPATLGRNPLWLRLILSAKVFEADRARIIDSAIRKAFEREWDEHPDARRDWRRVRPRDDQFRHTIAALAWLALQMLLNSVREMEFDLARLEVDDALKKRAGVADLSADDVVALARDAQILDYDRATGIGIRFRHTLLHDFFAALAVNQEPHALTPAVVDRAVNDRTWWPILLLAYELVELDGRRRSQFLAVLKGDVPSPERLWLAAAMFAGFVRHIESEEYSAMLADLRTSVSAGDLQAHRAAARHLAHIAPDRFVEVVRSLLSVGTVDIQDRVTLLVTETVIAIAGTPRALPLFNELLGATDQLGNVVVPWIVDCGPSVVPELITAALRLNGLAQRRATEALGILADPRATDPLVRLLDEQAGFDLVWTIEALGRIRAARAVPALVRMAHHSDVTVSMEAVRALGNQGSSAAPALLELIDPKHGSIGGALWVEQELVRIGTPAVPALIDALAGGRVEVRRTAASVLGSISDPVAIDALTRGTQDRDALVRLHSIDALGNLGEPAISPLLSALDAPDNQDAFLASRAARALATIGAAAVPAIITDLQRSLPMRKRAAIAEALGAIGARDGLGALRKLLDDPETLVRSEAAKALGTIGGDETRELLRGALATEAHQLVWIEAAAGMAHGGHAPAIDWLLGKLDKLTSSPDDSDDYWAFRFLIANHLVSLRERRVLPSLRILAKRATELHHERSSGFQRLLEKLVQECENDTEQDS